MYGQQLQTIKIKLTEMLIQNYHLEI